MAFYVQGISLVQVPPPPTAPVLSPHGSVNITYDHEDVVAARAAGVAQVLNLHPTDPTAYGAAISDDGLITHPMVAYTSLTAGIGDEGDSIHLLSSEYRYSVYGLTAAAMRNYLLANPDVSCTLPVFIPGALEFVGSVGSTVTDTPIVKRDTALWMDPIVDNGHTYDNLSTRTDTYNTGMSIVTGQYMYTYTPSDDVQVFELFATGVSFAVFSSRREPMLVTGHVAELPWRQFSSPPARQVSGNAVQERLSVPVGYAQVLAGLTDSACGLIALTIPWRRILEAYDTGKYFGAKPILHQNADFAAVKSHIGQTAERLMLPLPFRVHGSSVSTHPYSYETATPSAGPVVEWETVMPTGTHRVCPDRYTVKSPSGVTALPVFPVDASDPSEAAFGVVGFDPVGVTDFGFTRVRHDALAALIGLRSTNDLNKTTTTNVVDYAFSVVGANIHDAYSSRGPKVRPVPVLRGLPQDHGVTLGDDMLPVCVTLDDRMFGGGYGDNDDVVSTLIGDIDGYGEQYTRIAVVRWDSGTAVVINRADLPSYIASASKSDGVDGIIEPQSFNDGGDAGTIIRDFVELERLYTQAVDDIL